MKAERLRLHHRRCRARAGCVLANRLSADPGLRVLLLEAGPPDRNPYIHLPAGFAKLDRQRRQLGLQHSAAASRGQPRDVVSTRPRAGGSSSINAQVYTRGHAKDYDEWAAADGCAGWSYKDVLPYFRRAEDNQCFSNEYHGTGGPLGVSDQTSPHPITKVFLRAAQEAGLPFNPDFNGERQEGCGLYQVTQRNARRCSTAVGYLKPVLHRTNLSLADRRAYDACADREWARSGSRGRLRFRPSARHRCARSAR